MPEENRAPRFRHELLPVFRASLDAAVEAEALAPLLPRTHPHLAEQLRRAAASIVLNVGEGAGEYRRKEKARFYRIARRSATEVSALLELCVALGMLETNRLGPPKRALIRVATMLTRLCRSLEVSRPQSPPPKRPEPDASR